ncbi:MAG: hypothetical protein KAU01_00075 [Candidatus Cloacimonetes bacterium]|nr:hypothetical protein [Candidatus Cloacimonadota bacterium]
MVYKKIKDMCENVAKTLNSVYNMEKKESIIFPTYSDNKTIRISEQEARVLFYNELIKYKNITFSIETPTKLHYAGFAKHEPVVYNSGINGSSASIDLSIYDNDDHIIPKINMEFKSGQPSISNIQKDLLKLYSEPGDGIWFHLHKTTRTQETMKCLVNKFNLSIENIINFYKNKNIEYISDKDFFNLSKEIYLFLVLLNKNESNPIIKKCSVRISKNKELIYENNELKYVTIK